MQLVLRIVFFSFFLVLQFHAWAVPVRHGLWTSVRTTDGRTVRVTYMGDERVRFVRDADGNCYVRNSVSGLYSPVSAEEVMQRAAIRRAPALRRLPAAYSRKRVAPTTFSGEKRALVILAEFPNKKFSMNDPVGLYRKITNEKGYSDNGFSGSVADYFEAQSGGKFKLSFDVVGPVLMSQPYSYYGRKQEANVGNMIQEACLGVSDSVDFSRYDWNGDGEAEEVFVLYAGYGQADYDPNDENLIWPLMYNLKYDGIKLKLNGTVIDTYACANELSPTGGLSGIGTFCHEFSHCMGFPDLYDVQDKGSYGMGSWDLMAGGNYNGDSFRPAGYTAYEKMVCGWLEPQVLDSTVHSATLRPLADGGSAYVAYNDAYPDEYYVLENRQPVGFDDQLPGRGLLIYHVDYDSAAWEANAVNTIGTYNDYNNSHQRLAVVPADGDASYDSESTDAYPYASLDSLTDLSSPAATLFHSGTDGSRLLHIRVTQISQLDDGSVSFNFGQSAADVPPTPIGSVLLKETFDKCQGKGGNDGVFSAITSQADLVTDVPGWDYNSGCGADGCARFGSSSKIGLATTPAFVLPADTVTLTFRAACWDSKSDGTDLTLSVEPQTVVFASNGQSYEGVQLKRGQWTTYTLKLVGPGNCRITFTPAKRFFLDDVVVTAGVATGVTAVVRTEDNGYIFSLTGQRLGNNPQSLPRGLYIRNGRKVVLGR